MIRLLLYALIAWALYKLWGMLAPPQRDPRRPSPPLGGQRVDGGELVEDPQCGVYVPKESAVRGSGGKHFCSEACREAYEGKSSG